MFQINWGMENFIQKKEISLFSVGIFFLTVPINFAGRINQCSSKIRA